MSFAPSDKQRDRVLALVGLSFAVLYVLHARGIEDSFLSDSVGASGVPVAVGWLMGLACAGLMLRSLLPSRPETHALEPEKTPADAGPASPGASAPHLKAAGLLLILCAYVFALSWLGYVMAVGLLAGAVAWFAGARDTKVLLPLVLATGPLLWLLFDAVLKVRMPVGLWSGLLGN